MPIAAKIDQFGVLAWIGLMVLGFVVWWPLGLVALAFILATGRFRSGSMGCRNYGDRWQYKMDKMQWKMDRMRSRMHGGGDFAYAPSSGNRAFDEYRSETLKRLEEEQSEFKEFLDRLRFAKDKTEFDEFMNERRNQQAPDAPKPEPRPE